MGGNYPRDIDDKYNIDLPDVSFISSIRVMPNFECYVVMETSTTKHRPVTEQIHFCTLIRL